MTDDQTRPIETPQQPDETPKQPDETLSSSDATPAQAETPAEPGTAMDTIMAGSTGPAAAGSGRLRWLIALGVAGLAIAIAIGAILLFGSRPAPEALKYIPADAAVVVELRPELPGDQVQKLGNLLAHFPGFLDQATLPDKLDESFSRLVSGASGGSVDYRADIKPWLSGPAFIAFRGPVDGTGSGPTSLERGLISATTTGSVTCAMPFEGQAVSHETYRGLELTIGDTFGDTACVIDGRQALLGDVQSVRDALDAKGNGSGMDRSDDYRAARAAITGDQLATLYLEGQALMDMIPVPSGSPGGLPIPDLGNIRGRIPAWTMVGIRAEDDALVVDAVAAAVPAPTGDASFLPLPATHPSVLAGLVPSNTILLIENQGTGVTLQNTLTQLRSIPELSAPLQMLEGMTGGSGALVGWIEDAGIVALSDGPEPSVGLVLVAPDANAATQRVATINSLLGLLQLQGGGGIEIRQSGVAGVQVTTVTIPDAGSLVPPGSLPGGEVPTTGPVSLSFAARDRAVIVGTGEAFIAAIVNAQQGQHLSDNAGYKHALERGLPGGRTSVYVGVPAALDLAKTLLPGDVLSQLTTNVLPYLEPFEAVYLSATEEASAPRSRLVVTVTKP